MARDFRRKVLEIRCLVVNLLCSGVLCCALECSPVLEICWRRPTVLPEEPAGLDYGPGAGDVGSMSFTMIVVSVPGTGPCDRITGPSMRQGRANFAQRSPDSLNDDARVAPV